MEQDVLYLEKFVVVGSWQEWKHQGALVICMWRRSANKELVFKVEHEPDSVRDTNASMVFHNEKWRIIGYQQYLHKLAYDIPLLLLILITIYNSMRLN